MSDPVNHPAHYQRIPGIECIDVVEHMSFNLGNAIKYVWRAEYKNGIEDLEKSIWYIRREIERLRVMESKREIGPQTAKYQPHGEAD